MRTILLSSVLSVLYAAPFPGAPLGAQQVDHSLYDALLRQHVVNGRVDYDAFAKAPTFPQYLAQLEKVDPSRFEQNERLAYWINVYNAYTIQLIASSGERESIRNINRTLGVLRLKGPWTAPIVKAAGRTLTLDQVQHGMIRRESSDPRLHFAISCGAVSCPPLRNEAYTGEKLELQLDEQTYQFLTDTTRNQYDVKQRTFRQNIVFRYFARDFGESRKEYGEWLASWLAPTDSAAKATLTNGRFRIVDLPFDWSLNSLRASNTVK